jgi:hypothetical protein
MEEETPDMPRLRELLSDSRADRLIAAHEERQKLMVQAAASMRMDVADVMRRYTETITHIENTFRLRTGT